MLKPIKDWDDAFANMAHVAGSEELPRLWSDSAAAYRASGVKIDQGIAYGSHPRERFDLVWPEGTPKGLVVFIHGGFWMRLDKSYWTDFAEGARSNGWAICLPSYTLAPDARISQMTSQIAAAIDVAASMVIGPLRITGHSAGGHLATQKLCSGGSKQSNPSVACMICGP
jgi:arylformamidase